MDDQDNPLPLDQVLEKRRPWIIYDGYHQEYEHGFIVTDIGRTAFLEDLQDYCDQYNLASSGLVAQRRENPENLQRLQMEQIKKI